MIEFLAVVLALMGLTNQKEITKEEIQDSVYFVINPATGSGTGVAVVYKNRKVILTNSHVCEIIGDSGYIRDSKGDIYSAEIIKRSARHDLCMLKAPENAITLSLADYTKKNEKVFYAGFPLVDVLVIEEGFIRKQIPYSQEVDLTMCSKKGYTLNFDEIGLPLCYFQTSMIVTSITGDRGASGSPIVNTKGELTGLLFAVIGTSSKAVSVPLSEIKRFLEVK